MDSGGKAARFFAGLAIAAVVSAEAAFIFFFRYAYFIIQWFFLSIPVLFYWWALAAGWPIRRRWLAAYRGTLLAAVGAAFYEGEITFTNLWLILGASIAAIVLNVVLRRWAHGSEWYIDENGERQRVLAQNRGHVIYNPTTRNQRIIKEGSLRKHRRQTMAWNTCFILASILGSALAWNNMTDKVGAVIIIAIVGTGGVVAAILFLFELFWEILYLTGYQGMIGAKVLDPAVPPRPGLEQVYQQKAHGDARIAGAAEALTLLNPEQ